MEIEANTIGIISGVLVMGTSYLMSALAHAIITPPLAAKIMAYVFSFMFFLIMHPISFKIMESNILKVTKLGHAGGGFFTSFWVVSIFTIFIGITLHNVKKSSNKAIKKDV